MKKTITIVALMATSLASHAAEQTTDIKKLTDAELVESTGGNILQAVGYCSVSTVAVVAAAVGETIPLLSSITSNVVDSKMMMDEHTTNGSFVTIRDKTVASTLGGPD